MKKFYLLLCMLFTITMYSQCPELSVEDEQLYFVSTIPLEFDDDEIEIETDDDNESEYEYEDFYTTTTNGVLYYVYVFELDEGPGWNGITPFEVEFDNPEMTCQYPQNTLSTTHIERELTKYSINNNILTIDRATTIQLFDMNSRLVKSSKAEYIDISYLTKGMYIVLASNERMTSSIKLIL